MVVTFKTVKRSKLCLLKHYKTNSIIKKCCSVALVQLSFEWSHFRISSTDSKVRTTLYSIINSTTGKYCSVAFI